ncbi:diguanylate cyclase domain-containing protein, partial [Planctomycetota bacterium]
MEYAQVLIVNDERVSRRALQGLLRSHGISSAEAENGKQSLEYLAHNQADIALLDVNMDGMDGFDVLAEIRNQYSPTELSIVMVTSDSGKSGGVQALRNGANDYVTKPIDQEEVLARIATQLQLIGAKKALRRSEDRYALVAKATNDGLWDWDIPANEVHFSARWRELLGIDESERLARPSDWFDRIHRGDRGRVRDEIDAHLAGETPCIKSELRMLHADGSYRWMYCRGLAFLDDDGIAQRLAGSLSDVTARKVVDALTSLPNRMLFLDRLQRSLENANRYDDYNFAVLFIDLDNFKLINDSLGHEVGDRLLITIAQRLEASVRSHETVVGRLGGDEFAILIERVEHATDTNTVAERVLKRICEPCLIAGVEVFPCASIGLSFGKPESCSAEELIREADFSTLLNL